MHIADQSSFDFDDPQAAFELQLRDQYEKNRRDQDAYWGPDRYVIHWLCGCHDREWFDALPEYKKRMYRHMYETEQQRVEDGFPMREAEYVIGMAEHAFQESKERAHRWAEEIRQAFLERRPCPIVPLPGLFGNEWILRWAFDLACVPSTSLAEPPSAAERKTAE